MNIALDAFAGSSVTTANNVIAIGLPGENVSNTCYANNVRGVVVGNGDGINVIIHSSGQLGTSNSSRRFKKDIKPMDETSEAILALKPVTFHYKNQDTKTAEETPQFGLIAEDVAQVNPDLVVRDAEGLPLAVRHDAVNVMLLNEFLKAHKVIEEQRATIAQLKKEMATVVARLNEQDSKIQGVSNQVELNKAAPQFAASDSVNRATR